MTELVVLWRSRLMDISDYTSIQERIAAVTKEPTQQPTALLPFVGNPREEMPKGLPLRFRALREDKRGAIPGNLPPVLERLQIDSHYWLYMAQHFESRLKGLVGTPLHSKLPASH